MAGDKTRTLRRKFKLGESFKGLHEHHRLKFALKHLNKSKKNIGLNMYESRDVPSFVIKKLNYDLKEKYRVNPSISFIETTTGDSTGVGSVMDLENRKGSLDFDKRRKTAEKRISHRRKRGRLALSVDKSRQNSIFR